VRERVCVCVTLKTLKDTLTNWNASAHRCSNETAATRAATHCITLQHTANHCNTLRHTATQCSETAAMLAATHCTALQHTATKPSTLRHTTTHFHIVATTKLQLRGLQRTTIHSNTLKYTLENCNTRAHRCGNATAAMQAVRRGAFWP